jgi:hypothetical protein
VFAKHWDVENPGQHSRDSLSHKCILGSRAFPDGAFYVSAILQRDKAALKSFFKQAPFACPPLIGTPKVQHDDGVWLFVGSNPPQDTGNFPHSSKLRKVNHSDKKRPVPNVSLTTVPLLGRPEHVYKAGHSETWHVQVCGPKTWYVRPCVKADDWQGSPPQIAGMKWTVKFKTGGARIKIAVKAGGVLLINTRAWYHHTQIEGQERTGGSKSLSISYASDFIFGNQH